MDQAPSSPVIELQLRHRSIRRYTGEPIASELLAALIRAAQGAASSSFIQAYSLIRVTRPDARAAMSRAAGGQPWVEGAAEFLVLCADLRRVDGACQARGLGPLEGWSEHALAAVVDASLMAQNLMLAAESVGLGAVFIGGIRNEPQTLVEQLQLPELVAPLFGLCLGWPAESPEVKPRQPLELVLHQDVYRNPAPAALAGYDQVMADYYARRASNARRADWSGTTAQAVQGKKREHLLAFLQGQGFFRR